MRLFRIFDVAIKLGVRVRLIGYPAKISTLAGVLVRPSCRRLGLRISCSVIEGRNVPTRYVCESYSELWRGATRVTRDNRVTHINSATRYIPDTRVTTPALVSAIRTYIFYAISPLSRKSSRAYIPLHISARADFFI